MLQRFAVYLIVDPAIKRRILEELWHGRHIWHPTTGLKKMKKQWEDRDPRLN